MAMDHVKAHRFSADHRAQLQAREQACGCFYCKAIFRSTEIRDWIEDKAGTAVCPHCGIDSVIGESSGFPITPEFLERMHRYWF